MLNKLKFFLFKLKALLSHRYDYVLMKIFGRIFIIRYFVDLCIKNFYLAKIENNLNNDPVKSYLTVSEINSNLEKFGICEGLSIGENDINEILKFAKDENSFIDDNVNMGFKLNDRIKIERKINQKILKSSYYNVNLKSKTVNKISNSELLKNIAQSYLGKKSKRIASQLWWTFPADATNEAKSKAAMFFHRDLDDYKFLKFFFYITDVDLGDGEHVYVKTSHKINLLQNLREKFRVSRERDEKIINWYKKINIHKQYGKRGTGFAEDTFGFHKGTKPKNNARLILCLVYARKDYKLQELVADDKNLKYI